MRGKYFFTDRHTYIIGTLFLLSLAPLVYMTLEFGQANVQSVGGIVDSKVDRFSLEGWLWYLVKMPQQTGWAVLACALAGTLMLAIKPRWNGPRVDLFLLFAWFITGYLFYSAIDLKESRHSIFILLPVCVIAINFLCQLFFKTHGHIFLYGSCHRNICNYAVATPGTFCRCSFGKSFKIIFSP